MKNLLVTTLGIFIFFQCFAQDPIAYDDEPNYEDTPVTVIVIKPDLEISYISHPSSVNMNTTLYIDVIVTNTGTATAGMSNVRGGFEIAPFTFHWENVCIGALQPGESTIATFSLFLDSNNVIVWDRLYYFFDADIANQVSESNENNNQQYGSVIVN